LFVRLLSAALDRGNLLDHHACRHGLITPGAPLIPASPTARTTSLSRRLRQTDQNLSHYLEQDKRQEITAGSVWRREPAGCPYCFTFSGDG